MTLGKKKELSKLPLPKLTKEEKAEHEQAIKNKLNKYISAFKTPPAIHQFATQLTESETKKTLDFFMKYRPENKAEKKVRLAKENPKEGAKPVLTKFGLNHVIALIETKKAKLVLIAADVHPIENVVYLPTLCKKMGVAYAIVKEKAALGKLVNLKQTTCVCLCESDKSDEAKFNDIIKMCNATFSDRYEKHMTIWGGRVKKSMLAAAEK